MDELPVALLSDILSRVSSQSLLRYRCVCKRWREVIDDPYFRNSLHRVKEPACLYCDTEEGKICLLKIHEEETTHEEAMTQVIEMAQFPGLKNYAIRGDCNGLLFFQHIYGNKANLLINPLTREIQELPKAPYIFQFMSVSGIGLDCSTNVYKMVQIDVIGYGEETRIRTTVARVYDFEKHSWRTCKAPPPTQGPDPRFAFASGALNWFLLRDSSVWTRAILSFDLTREEFSLIPLPDGFSRPGLATFQWDLGRMLELGGSLALAHHSDAVHITVWVLKDYTSREWTKKYSIDTAKPPCLDVVDGNNYYVIGPYKRDKLILHQFIGEVYEYDINKERFTRCRTKDIALRGHALFWCKTLSFVTLKRHEDLGL
ncbi:hypothetical protein BT93_K1565 [Corymbia citriodora subsp. variegata]|nr:hypothetical protein BT93_K1565 [Corymbia citriodora subsp. variegata]